MNTPFSRFSEYFIAVAKTGSLRKAADQLFISVSAVHRQIALAEEELGIVLFERLPNGLKLTLAGELLYADVIWQKNSSKPGFALMKFRAYAWDHRIWFNFCLK